MPMCKSITKSVFFTLGTRAIEHNAVCGLEQRAVHNNPRFISQT